MAPNHLTLRESGGGSGILYSSRPYMGNVFKSFLSGGSFCERDTQEPRAKAMRWYGLGVLLAIAIAWPADVGSK